MARNLILIVDDIELNREILIEILQDEYETIQAENGFEAVELIMQHSNNLSLVLLDIMMPDMDGYEVLEVMRTSGYLSKIPVIIITAAGNDENEIKGLVAGASDFVSKPFNLEIVKCRVSAQVELRNHRVRLEDMVEENVQAVLQIRSEIAEYLASVIENRHVETGQHVKRTKNMAKMLLHQIQDARLMDKEIRSFDLSMAPRAFPLHDIGKIRVPDNILLKPGKLTSDEFEVIKMHPVWGAEMIKQMENIEGPEFLKCAYDICLYHHEKWDGTGYPKGLVGDEIPFLARIMAIVDVYDALISSRVYKPAFTYEQAFDIIRDGSGRHFDPVVAKVFLDNCDSYKMGDL